MARASPRLGRLSLTPRAVTSVFCMILWPITLVAIWVADLFTTVVDDNAVRFARWLEVKCLWGEEGSEESVRR